MTIGTAFRDLSRTIEDLEDAGLSVTGVGTDADELVTEEGVTVTVSAAADLLDGIDLGAVEVEAREATVLEDGRIEVELDVSIPLEAAGDDAEEASTGADDGEETAGDGSEEPTAGGDDDGSETPVHRDPERLRAAYEAHDSFTEMTEALGTDVTAQTVRRNMIKHGIHEPATAGDGANGAPDGDAAEADGAAGGDAATGEGDLEDGAADGGDTDEAAGPVDDEGEAGAGTTMADGIDLPAGVSLDDLKEAVRTAHTLHEVQREIGVDRERGRRLLEELGLLEFVTGRLSNADREVTAEEIDERVRRATPGGS